MRWRFASLVIRPSRVQWDSPPREIEVLHLVAQGLTDASVAAQLYISPRTVSQHLRSIYAKLGVSSRAGATRFAVEHALG